MKKKMLLLTLIAALMLSLVGTAAAAPFRLDGPKVSIQIPENITAVDISEGDVYAMRMTVMDSNAEVIYAINKDSSLAGKWTQDLSQDELTAISQDIMGEEETIGFLFVYEHEGITYATAENESGSFILIFRVLDGWISSCSAIDADGPVDEDDIVLADRLLLAVTYDDYPADEAPEAEAAEGETAETAKDEAAETKAPEAEDSATEEKADDAEDAAGEKVKEGAAADEDPDRVTF